MNDQAKRFYEFGPFRLDTTERLLLCNGKPISLTPKAFETLLVLVQNSGHILEKDELMTRIWPDSFVEEATLAQNIFTLRKVLGERHGKHHYIETVPRRGYRFTAKVSEYGNEPATPSKTGIIGSKAAGRSIAVLPFNDLSQDESREYFGLGMADALITKLSNIRSITVRPTSAVLRYANARQTPVEAGNELMVEMVLEGAIQMVDDIIRVTVQLVNVESGASIWADKVDEKFVDIFTLQDTISSRVAEALTLKLTSDEKELLIKRFTDSSKAYEFYLKGRHQWNKWTLDGFEKSISFFRQAINEDPNYALAYAGLADVYNALSFYGYVPPKEAMPQAKSAAEKALSIDDNLAEAHFSLATVLFFFEWDWPFTEREFDRAIELNSSYALAHQGYGLYLIAMGRTEEALAKLRRSVELDPASPLLNTTLGFPYYFAGRYDQAMEQYRKVTEMDPDFGLAHSSLGDVYIQKEMYEEAIAEHQKAMRHWGTNLNALASLGYAYAVSGRRDEALKIINELKDISGQQYVSPVPIAMVYIGLGEQDMAFEWLEKGFEEQSNRLVFLNVQPAFNALRDDPRFSDILRRIGLTPG